MSRHVELGLGRDGSGRFVPWVIGLMVFLAILAGVAAFALGDLARRWDTGLTGSMTVEVAPGTDGAPPPAASVDKVLSVLRATPGIAHAEPLSSGEIDRLLGPWLGTGASAAGLPIPVLIDVRLATGAKVDAPTLAAALKAAAPGTSVDDHGTWLADLLALVRAAQAASLGTIILIAAAAVLTVVFAARAGLAVHRDIVALLHLIGAPDLFVARQFQRHVLGLALRGAVGGTVLAGLTLAGLARAAASLPAGLLPGGGITAPQWVAVALVPPVAVLLATVTARFTVLRALARMP